MRSSSGLQEAGVPRSTPESTDRAQPGADPGPQRATQALSAATAFYSPPAFVWVPAATTVCGGVRGRLWRCTAPRPRAPPAFAPPGLASVAGEGLRSAAYCCLWSPPPGAAVAASPPAGAARWYNRAPSAGGRGCERRSDPWGSVHASANGPGRDSCPAPKFPRSSGLSLACAPDSPSAQPWQITNRPDTRGYPRVFSGGSCQTRAPGAIPSSLLYSPSWHQSPEPCQLLGPGIPPALARGLPDTPVLKATRRKDWAAKASAWPISVHQDSEGINIGVTWGELKGSPQKWGSHRAPAAGCRGFPYGSQEEGRPPPLLCEG